MAVYKIQWKVKNQNTQFKDEIFLTGGKMYSFKNAHNIKKKLSKMCSSILYKVIKI